MAVASSSDSKQKEKMKSPNKQETKSQNPGENVLSSSPSKSNKGPRVQLVGGRIYDSVNGKSCHQCRQKTMDFTAMCKNQRNDKPCPIMFCHKCLSNRYGENAEEVAALGDWDCPRCRGICNCSICMKKRGHQPTGILINRAKAIGYSSVSEMLLKGAENLNSQKVVENTVGPAKEITASKKEVGVSPRKRGKENSFEGKMDSNLHSESSSPNDVEKLKKCKGEGLKKLHDGNVDNNITTKITSQGPHVRKSKKMKQEGRENRNDDDRNVGVLSKESSPHGSEKQQKKMKWDRLNEKSNGANGKEISMENRLHDERKPKKSKSDGLGERNSGNKEDATLVKRTSPRKSKISKKVSHQDSKLNIGVDPQQNKESEISGSKEDLVELYGNAKRKEVDSKTVDDINVVILHNADIHAEILLPQGTELTTVGGVDVRPEDVGNALQFLEFCATFGKILEVKEWQPGLVLQDLLHGRTGRRGKFSLTVQFHIQLLSLILEEEGQEYTTLSPTDGKNSWFHALKKCFSESKSIQKTQVLDSLNKVADYETLNSSEKLKLLNLLCDELLGTVTIRTWIDEQNLIFSEKAKEAKIKVLAAKDKEKSLKQKMKDDIAKAIIAKHGAPLSISEHEAIVAKIKSEAAHAHAKVLESQGMFSKKSQVSDAVRIEPIFTASNGHVYWRLSCCSSKSDMLHQDIGRGEDPLTLDEKWFALDAEEKEAVEKHIFSLSGKRLRAHGAPEAFHY
ncbi:Zinc-finger domain of monoamine-oxidase A repressor R1 protein [Abeliophyllum distichum]|uniref:Zinc-finger domain of monoamine-oxidase A repressor R1 protein n=1 Tax=Abeliophyllum distichum TaxID=126358 RepID=A0ABD1SCD2_9LAMI